VSVEQDVANELNVSLGDTLVWNVQGVDIPTVVGSFRTVDWQRFSTNFFVIFPAGVLEEAPQFYVMLTRTETAEASAAVQAAVVQRYPNVSAIDLSLVLSVFDEVFGRIAFAIRFMALFSILTGLIVLAGAVIVSRVQRISESVLLKTLGASRGNVYRIMLAEYLFLGLLATLTGLVLAVAGSALLAVFAFDAPFTLPPLPLLVALLVVTGLTVGIGLFNSRGIYDRPPLEVLRAEA
ncbi:MAG: FtsX-like permease family protein, partial [Bacteroidota bacterium]